MGTKRNVDMSVNPSDAVEPKKGKKTETANKEEKAVEKVQKKVRSSKYTKARSLVDRTKTYDIKKAVELLKKVSYSKFAGTVSFDAVVKDEKLNMEIAFPYSTGKVTKVAIINDDVLSQIEKGNIDFDVLIATPEYMPKIAKYARTLGPKGLMPNPKNGTVTNDPEKRAKELSGGKIRVKTEKKDPLIHVVVGKTDQKDAELEANITHLAKTIGPRAIRKAVISATMSPGIRLDLTELITA